MKLLVGALLGAVIGYITNFIAIKMLFRPLNEKRIFGIRIPFTPGLIPKEKARIANSVGVSVGKYLLTDNMIVERLKSRDIKDEIKNKIRSKIDYEDKQLTAKAIIIDILGDKVTFLSHKSSKLLDSFVSNIFNDRDISIKTSELIVDSIYKRLEEDPDFIYNILNSEKASEILDKIIKANNAQDKISNIILNALGDFKLQLISNNSLVGDVVPQEIFSAIELFVYNNRVELCNDIKDALRNEEIAYRIKGSIREKGFGGLGPIVSRLINEDKIYDRVAYIIDDYLDNDDNRIELVKIINDHIEDYKVKTVEEMLSNIPSNISDKLLGDLSSYVGNMVIDNISSDKLLNVIKANINYNNNDSIIAQDGVKEKAKSIIESIVYKILNNSDIQEAAKAMVRQGVHCFLNKPLTDEDKDNIINFAEEISIYFYDNVMMNSVNNIVKNLNISKMVEEQINMFDTDFAEKIILEIAKKELKAITWMGALLGAILGILSPIINSLL